jgi:hypothetical protein
LFLLFINPMIEPILSEFDKTLLRGEKMFFVDTSSFFFCMIVAISPKIYQKKLIFCNIVDGIN